MAGMTTTPTAEERLHEAANLLTLIEAAMRANPEEVNVRATFAAAARAAAQAHDLLVPLLAAPGELLTWSPPDCFENTGALTDLKAE